MTRSASICLALLTALLASKHAHAQGDDISEMRAADAVVGIFFNRPSIAAALTPRDPEDDARVDRLLERCAVGSAGRPAIQAAIYRRLIDRASERRRGERAALEYLLALHRAQPRHASCSADLRALYFDRAYEAEDRAGRAALGEAYIEVLLEVAQAHERGWRLDAAGEAQQRALSVARANRSPYRTVLDDYGRTLDALDRATRRLDQLREQAPRDRVAARLLAIRLAAERSDLDDAVAAAEQSGDADLLIGMRLAAMPLHELEPMQVLVVAEMFRAMADDPGLELDRAKAGALQESVFYFQHFLFCYTTRDVVRLRAAELADELPGRIADLRPEPIRRPAGPWRALAGGISEPRVGNSGNLVDGRHLRVRSGIVYAHRSAFTIPVQLDDTYDLRMAISCTHANERTGISLYFPIGRSRGGRLVLGEGGENSCRIHGLAPIERLAGFRFPEDTPVAMVLGVHPDGGGQVHLTLSLDGTQVLDWTGPIRTLRVDDNERPPRRHGNIFRVGAGTTYEFLQIEVRRAAEQ